MYPPYTKEITVFGHHGASAKYDFWFGPYICMYNNHTIFQFARVSSPSLPLRSSAFRQVPLPNFPFSVCLALVCWQRLSLCIPGQSRTCSVVPPLLSNMKPSCLSFPRVEIWDMCHHSCPYILYTRGSHERSSWSSQMSRCMLPTHTTHSLK